MSVLQAESRSERQRSGDSLYSPTSALGKKQLEMLSRQGEELRRRNPSLTDSNKFILERHRGPTFALVPVARKSTFRHPLAVAITTERSHLWPMISFFFVKL